MAANVNIVVNAQDRASGTLRKIRNGFAEIFKVALGIRLSQVLNRAGEGLRDFAMNSIDAAAQLQVFEIGVETLIAREYLMADATLAVSDAFGMAREVTGDYVKDLQTIALLSPYQFGDVQKMFRQAMAFGFMADEAKIFTTATLNMAAGVGAGNQQLDRMAYNLAQIRLQGKVTKLDIRQLALAGFDLMSVLRFVGEQQELNIETHLDFNKAINSGAITWAEFTTGYAAYADTYFGGASERMARTVFGLRNTFKDIFAVTMPQILGPTLDAFTGFASTLLDKLLMLRDSGILEAWGERIKVSFDTKIKPVLDFLFEGKTDHRNPFVRMLNMFKHLKEEGFFGNVWAYIFEQMTGIDVGPLQNFIQKFLDLIGYLKAGEGLFSDPVLANLGMMFGLDEDVLPNLKAKILGIIDEIRAIIDEGILSRRNSRAIGNLLGIDPQTVRTVQTFFRTLFNWINSRWLELKTGMQPIIDVFVNTFLPTFIVIGALLFKIGTIVWDFLVRVFQTLSEWFAKNGDLIATWWEFVLKVFGGIAIVVTALITGIAAFLGPTFDGILSWVLNVGAAIMAFFTGDWERGWQLLSTGFDDLIQGIKDGWDAMVEWFKGIWNDHLWPIIEEWIAKAVTTGANFIAGIVQGFLAGIGQATTDIISGLSRLVTAIKKFLGISSPSKLFEQIGMQSMAGYLKGFGTTNIAVAGLTQGAIPAMAGAGGRRQSVVIHNHYSGLTLQNRLQAETALRPIIGKIQGR